MKKTRLCVCVSIKKGVFFCVVVVVVKGGVCLFVCLTVLTMRYRVIGLVRVVEDLVQILIGRLQTLARVQ